MKKFISIFVAAILLCTALVSCGGGTNEEVAKDVTVTVEADGVMIIENVKVTVEGIDGAAPLAMDAIIAALTENDIEYDIGEFAGYDRFEKIDEYGLENGKYIWELYMNGDDEPADGRLATIEIDDRTQELLLKRNAYESVITESTEETTAAPTQAVETVDDGFEG